MLGDEELINPPPPLDGGKAVLKAILAGAASGAPPGMVSSDSRHAGVGTATIDMPVGSDGEIRTYVYLRRQFLPDPGLIDSLRTHSVGDTERLDHIATRELNDPLAFWKLCDANLIMAPLHGPGPVGARLRVPVAMGVSSSNRFG